MKKVDVMVQSMQTMATPSRQQVGKLVCATVAMTMPDVKLDMALGMIMPCCAPGFFLGTKVFTNAGVPAGQLICDWAWYMITIEELKRQVALLPPDYLWGANGTDCKPAPYVSV